MVLSPREDEEAIVEQAKYNRQAFLHLYEYYLPHIYRYAYYHTLNKQDAEDVVSQTFLQALENINTYQNRGIPFGHWLFRIAANIMGRHRKHKQRERLWNDSQESEYSEKTEIDLDLEKLELLKHMQNLPDSQRQVLELRFIQDLSVKDVANILGRSEGAVKQLTMRAVSRLKEGMIIHAK